MDIPQTKATTRYEQIISMRQSGSTYAAIGRELGISRERVRQILNSLPYRQNKTSGKNHPLRVSDVAHLLNVHTNTVRRWSNKGIIETYRIGPRGDRRFKQNQIKNLLKKRTSH